MPATPLYLFVALPCEAQPLVDFFKLKKHLNTTAFSLYQREHISLTVTGVGKAAMAAGVGYTMALSAADCPAVLLNIGIAGCRDQDLGTLLLADKVLDQTTQRAFYPQLVVTPPCASVTLQTVAQAQTDYTSADGYEMEAAAFYETAIRFSSAELIQCLKVVSDNAEHAATEITPSKVKHWLAAQMPVIEAYAQQLMQLAQLAQPVVVPHIDGLLQRWHFTRAEQMQLQRLLMQHWLLFALDARTLLEMSFTRSGQVLHYLRTQLATQSFGDFHA